LSEHSFTLGLDAAGWLDRRESIPWEISLIVVQIVVPALLTELIARHKSLKS